MSVARRRYGGRPYAVRAGRLLEEARRIVDPVLKKATPVFEYEPGTWGPCEEVDRMWRRPTAGIIQQGVILSMEEAWTSKCLPIQTRLRDGRRP